MLTPPTTNIEKNKKKTWSKNPFLVILRILAKKDFFPLKKFKILRKISRSDPPHMKQDHMSNRCDNIFQWLRTEKWLIDFYLLTYSHTPNLEMLSHLKISLF